MKLLTYFRIVIVKYSYKTGKYGKNYDFLLFSVPRVLPWAYGNAICFPGRGSLYEALDLFSHCYCEVFIQNLGNTS